MFRISRALGGKYSVEKYWLHLAWITGPAPRQCQSEVPSCCFAEQHWKSVSLLSSSASHLFRTKATFVVIPPPPPSQSPDVLPQRSLIRAHSIPQSPNRPSSPDLAPVPTSSPSRRIVLKAFHQLESMISPQSPDPNHGFWMILC